MARSITSDIENQARLLREAEACHRSGRLVEAERWYRAFLEKQPDAPDALFHFGILLAGKGDYDQAAALLKRAVHLRPAAADLHANLGVVLAAELLCLEAYLCALLLEGSVEPRVGDERARFPRGISQDRARLFP